MTKMSKSINFKTLRYRPDFGDVTSPTLPPSNAAVTARPEFATTLPPPLPIYTKRTSTSDHDNQVSGFPFEFYLGCRIFPSIQH